MNNNVTTSIDICLFVKGIPSNLVLHSKKWMFAKIAGQGSFILDELSQSNIKFKAFAKSDPGKELKAFLFRGQSSELKVVLRQAVEQLDLVIVGYSLMVDSPVGVSKVA